METIKIFLASSNELVEDRKAFRRHLGDENDRLIQKGMYLKLVVWEDAIDAMSQTRLQDEYNKAIQECDIFIMLFYSKVGKYTEEEFGVAFESFRNTGKPLVYTYFKDGASEVNESLQAFKDKLSNLGHFFTKYETTSDLLLHFNKQLDKLSGQGIINPIEKVQKELKELVSKDLKKALGKAKSVLSDDSDKTMGMTMLEGRLERNKKSEMLGTATPANITMEFNRITMALLSMIDDFEKEDLKI